MQPEYLLIGLIALVCPVTMGAMMWFMMKGMRGGHAGHHEEPAHKQPTPASADLRTALIPTERR